MNELIYIIDGNSYAYRFFYAMPSLTTKDGMEVHSMFGFFSMLKKLLKEKKPDYLCVVFDSPVPTFRHKIYEEYKIQREKMPESLQNQIEIIKTICKNAGIQIFQLNGYEADDIIANLAVEISKKNIKVMIMTSDKDMIQIVNDNINIYKIGKDKETILTPEKIKEEYGINPNQIIDVLALMGDTSDNIPGVNGIGEKTAIKLIKQYQNIDNILKNIDEIKPDKIKESIKQSIDIIKLSRQLAILNINGEIPLKLDFCIENCSVNKLNMEILEKEFLKYNFKSLVASDKLIKQKINEFKLKTYNIKSFDEIKEDIQKQKTISIFIMGGERKPELIIIGFESQAYYIYGNDFNVMPDFIKDKNIITNSAKFIYSCFDNNRNLNIQDIMLMAYILNSEKTYRDISHIFTEYLGGNYLSYEDITGKGAKKIMIALVDEKIISSYCSSIIQGAHAVCPLLIERLKKESLQNIYYDIELPLAYVLSCMEKTGLKIDTSYLELLIEKFNKKIKELEKEIYIKAGGEFNINSPKQLSDILFNKLNLPKLKKIKTGFSTDNEVLMMLKDMHPIVADLISYRTIIKIKTGFLDVIRGFVNKDSTIFPYYHQNITATGRLSSSDPNIQNIPVRDDEGKEIRKIFIPLYDNSVILKADYSQIELRILAHFSGDNKLKEYFLLGKDVHSMTAAEIFGIPEKDVTQNQRRIAKTINFGIIYGMSKYGLSKELKISLQQAGYYIDRFFNTYKMVKKYHEDIINSARLKGYVETILGRKRYIQDINSRNKTLREFAERIAINSPIQGSAADIIKKAMIEIMDWLKNEKLKSKMILQIHDELVFSVFIEEKEIIKLKIKEIMENTVKLNVPLEIKIGEGKNWYECG
ncbi:MAG: DNA polymerase I [Candidatus Goldbacteria bacterium]|nr:DNA polymerase I [Candidatus Goldiibacteriota bacterium]